MVDDMVQCEVCGQSVQVEEAVEQVYGDDEPELAGGSWWACRTCVEECRTKPPPNDC